MFTFTDTPTMELAPTPSRTARLSYLWVAQPPTIPGGRTVVARLAVQHVERDRDGTYDAYLTAELRQGEPGAWYRISHPPFVHPAKLGSVPREGHHHTMGRLENAAHRFLHDVRAVEDHDEVLEFRHAITSAHVLELAAT